VTSIAGGGGSVVVGGSVDVVVVDVVVVDGGAADVVVSGGAEVAGTEAACVVDVSGSSAVELPEQLAKTTDAAATQISIRRIESALP
jgi:hypothetical protein